MGLKAEECVEKTVKRPDENLREKERYKIRIEKADVLPIKILYRLFNGYSRRFGGASASSSNVYPTFKIYMEGDEIKEIVQI